MKRLLISLFLTASCLNGSDTIAKAHSLLLIIEHDEYFLERTKGTLAGMRERGEIPEDAHLALLGEISADGYLHASSMQLGKELSDEDLDALNGFLAEPKYLRLYRALAKAHRELSGEALRQRREELVSQDPETWRKATAFFQSKPSQKLADALGRLEGIQREAYVTEMLRATEVVKAKRRQAQPTSQPTPGPDAAAPNSKSSGAPLLGDDRHPPKNPQAGLPDREPKPIQLHNPEYPFELLKRNIKATIVVQFIVDKEGLVQIEKIEQSPDPLFDAAIRKAAKEWKYTPGMKNGKVVATRMRIPIAF